MLPTSEESDGVVLWLEDQANGDGGQWTVGRYSLVARGLGLLSGCLRRWPAHAEVAVAVAGPACHLGGAGGCGFEVFAETVVRDPLLARLYPPEVVAVMVQLWQARRRICDILADWPQVLGHLDAMPANVIVRDGQRT